MFPNAVANEFSPDHSECFHCHKPITWNEYTYVHDDTGFADCGIVINGECAQGRINGVLHNIVIDPDVTTTMKTMAEPITWFNEDGSRK